MVLGVVALIIALAALVIALCRDPFQTGIAFCNPFNALGGYDLDTPAGAAKARDLIESKDDIRAQIALQKKFRDSKAVEERTSSFKIESEADFKKEKKTDKEKKSPWTGEYKVLFVSYKEDGEDQKEVVSVQKHSNGLWARHPLSSGEVGLTNKELQKKMEEWFVKPKNAFEINKP